MIGADGRYGNGRDIAAQLRNVDRFVRQMCHPQSGMGGDLDVAHDPDPIAVVGHRVEMQWPARYDILRRPHGPLEFHAVEAKGVQRYGLALRILPHERKKLIARRARAEKRLRAKDADDVSSAKCGHRERYEDQKNKKPLHVRFSLPGPT
jgi:hypothetical protein